MGIVYKATKKELLDLKNRIVVETAIPALLKHGFNKSPFSTSWNGRNGLNDYSYELCRLTADSILQIVEFYVSRGDRWIQIKLNIFRLHPRAESLEDLQGNDGIKFKIPPNSLTELRLRSDDIEGMPLFRLSYMNGYRLSRYYTKFGLRRNIIRLQNTIEKDIQNIDYFIARWNEFHNPLLTNWTGHPIAKEDID